MDISTNPPTNDAKHWAVPALTVMSLWSVGAGMIIYLAGLKGIPESSTKPPVSTAPALSADSGTSRFPCSPR